jgi:hypothetical protein
LGADGFADDASVMTTVALATVTWVGGEVIGLFVEVFVAVAVI